MSEFQASERVKTSIERLARFRVLLGWASSRSAPYESVVRYLRLRADRKTYDADFRGDTFERAEAERLARVYGGQVVP